MFTIIDKILPLAIFFSTGFFIPVLSRFLMKFYPCSMHSYFGDILKFYINKKQFKLKHTHKQYKYLKKQYLYTKLLWGALYLILFTLIGYLVKNYVSESYPLILLYIFLFFIGFAANIDSRCRLIPDIITFPLMMVAFLISAYCQNNKVFSQIYISDLTSIYSAISAYILCFILALLYYFKNPYSFGGGDVKLISAVSAFVGFFDLPWIFLFMFVAGIFYVFIKKEKFLPLAPMIFISFIVWLLLKILYYI